MKSAIEVRITPDYLYLTASQAAEHISQAILAQLPLWQRLRCYGAYLLEPAFIKEHVTGVMEDAPFFIGTLFQVWNYLSSSLKHLEAGDTAPPVRENLIRIVSIPLKYAKHESIILLQGGYLPPSLQKVFMLLEQPNIDLGDIGDASIERAKSLLRSTTVSMDVAASVASAYGNHNQYKHLALSHVHAGYKKEGFYYAEQACVQLSQGFSMDETLLTCDALLHDGDGACLPEEYGLLHMKARIQFTLGAYSAAAHIYESLVPAISVSVRNEAMRKLVRCHERLGNYQKAISLGESFLPKMNDAYAVAKLQRSLGWTYIQLGGVDELSKALDISSQAECYFMQHTGSDALYNLARTLNNLGVAQEQLADKPDVDKGKALMLSIRYHQRCKKIMHTLGSLRWESASLLNLSVVQRKRGRLSQALNGASEAIRVKTWICDFDELPICHYNIALTYLKKYFFDMKVSSIHQAVPHIDAAMKLRQQQESGKRVGSLLCLKVLCELMLQSEYQLTESMKELLAMDDFPEDDKVPLFHKTLATMYAMQNQACPKCLNRIHEEQEMPSPEEILAYRQ